MTSPRRKPIADAGRKVRAAPASLVERRLSRFLREPPSIRIAASVIVMATAAVVVGGGVLIRVLDHREYANVWVGMWWSIQTVTTVGYGDVTPKDVAGRLVGAFVMLEGIAFLAIVTAAITSTFVTRAQSERAQEADADEAAQVSRVETRLDELAADLKRVEAMLRDLGNRLPSP